MALSINLNGLYSSRQRGRDWELVKEVPLLTPDLVHAALKERIWVHIVGLRLGERGVEVAIARYVLTRLVSTIMFGLSRSFWMLALRYLPF